MPRTATPAPTDRSMWRRLLSRVHPDRGGDGELFVWARELQERVADAPGCGSCPGPAPSHRPRGDEGRAEASRVDYPPDLDHASSTARAVAMSADVGEPHAGLLRMLARCSSSGGVSQGQERRGATYKQLAYVAHLAGMGVHDRAAWYEISGAVPLSQRHAGHLIERLQERAA